MSDHKGIDQGLTNQESINTELFDNASIDMESFDQELTPSMEEAFDEALRFCDNDLPRGNKVEDNRLDDSSCLKILESEATTSPQLNDHAERNLVDDDSMTEAIAEFQNSEDEDITPSLERILVEAAKTFDAVTKYEGDTPRISEMDHDSDNYLHKDIFDRFSQNQPGVSSEEAFFNHQSNQNITTEELIMAMDSSPMEQKMDTAKANSIHPKSIEILPQSHENYMEVLRKMVLEEKKVNNDYYLIFQLD